MIRIIENFSLKHLNTFGIEVKSTYFAEVSNEKELQELIQQPVYRDNKHLILGGGSNILFTKDFDGLLIKSSIMGITIEDETNDTILIAAASGEIWHDLVIYCIQNNYGGIENLSLIPGTTGASPIQNIGAYGVEIKDVVARVDAIDLSTGNKKSFTNEDCHFGYRESIFKHELKEKYFITNVVLKLTKNIHHLNLQYGAIQEVLKQHNIEHPTIKDVSDAVISIRQSKLPDPRVIGNAGSFFKNPTIPIELYESIKQQHSSIPSYPVDNQNIKVPAGWLIEQCGWKGKRIGNIGVHPQQALVLVNYGDGNGNEIFQLAKNIQSSVKEKFNITLSTEVNII